MTWAVIMEGVQIGRRCRFQTDLGYSGGGLRARQPGRIAWNVFDDPLLGSPAPSPISSRRKGRCAADCATVDALAQVIGCDSAALRETLAAVYPGRPDAFGRRFKRALTPPYHAVKVTGALFHTQGGLDVDAHCRVLRQDGTALPNLLAAGGAARGVSGNEVSGYISGNGLLSALGGGWVAAGTLIRQLRA
jgi:fumarate reductase flavoprotein subunit